MVKIIVVKIIHKYVKKLLTNSVIQVQFRHSEQNMGTMKVKENAGVFSPLVIIQFWFIIRWIFTILHLLGMLSPTVWNQCDRT